MKANNLTVVKDNRVITASYRLSLVEQRVVLAAIAKIDSISELSASDGFTVTVSEISDLFLDSKTSAYSELKKAINSLYNRTITLDSDGSERRWIYEKRYNKDQGSATLFFSPTIIPFLSGLRGNFTQYKLHWIREFKSSYSIRIYELLVRWTSKGEKEIDVDWLKNTLGVSEKYSRTSNFIARVISPAVEEINKHSNLEVAYGTRKTGRVVTHIQFKFNIKSKASKKTISTTQTLDKFVRENPVLTKGKSTAEVIMLMNKKQSKM